MQRSAASCAARVWLSLLLLALASQAGHRLFAQAPPPTREIGTVSAVASETLTLTTDAGQSSKISVPEGTRVLQIAPGSTSLQSAVVIALSDIAVGDRILATGKAGATPDTFSASRVILMKSIDIAKLHAAETDAWRRHGTGGLVDAVDPASGIVTMTVHGKKVQVLTTPATIFRRYGSDSVKFEDARPSAIAQLAPGDQMRVRGTAGAPGTDDPIHAVEIVSGSFKNLSGTIGTIDVAAGTFTLKDLATKKQYTVHVTPNSAVRFLPPEDAARFAAQERKSAAAADADAGPHTGAPAAKAAVAAGTPPAAAPQKAAGSASALPPTGAGGAPGAPAGAERLSLSQMMEQLPQSSLADLRAGDAVMLVASEPQPGSEALTAVTLLAGVEPILTATPKGKTGMTLSPWNVSGEPGA